MRRGGDDRSQDPAHLEGAAGAENGSEMGAFAREMRPIKESSILIKYQEYMPLGLTPILIRVV